MWSPLPNGVLTVACRMYAFDVHCNSYFPLFILLYGEAAYKTLAAPPTLHTSSSSCSIGSLPQPVKAP